MSEETRSAKDSSINEPMFLKKWKTSTVVAILLACVTGLGVVKTSAESVDTILVFLHLKRDALDLARDTARGQFSDALVRLEWRRVYWSRRVLTAMSYDLPSPYQAEIWKSYLATVEEWTANSMVNILGLEGYYSAKKRSDFESTIIGQFAEFHTCLLRLKYPDAFRNTPKEKLLCQNQYDNPTLGRTYEPSISNLEQALDWLNSSMYCFATGLKQDKTYCGKNAGGTDL